ncbi:MAG: glycosyltransferase family A protein [Acidimicrobiales bacterium]|nr:glycosyltransferase family A protein [Acidimicrobiales bacterium]
MTRWRVSVVIAVRDGERYLGETLESITTQSRPVDEVIVVDDGSTDATVPLARSFGETVTVVEQPARGAGSARNTGIALATGEVLALCDADDLWVRSKTERQLGMIEDPSLAVAVFCGVEEFLSPDLDPDARRGRAPRTLTGPTRMASGLLATRAAFDATGPFREVDGADWFDWCSRLADAVPAVRHHPEVLLRRRLHANNSTLIGGDASAARLAAVAEHLRRRRGAQG